LCSWVTEEDVAAAPADRPGDAAVGPSYAQLAGLVVEQAAAIAALKERISVLEAENAGLRRRLGRDSGNSSMPPSADDAVPGGTPPARRCAGGGGGGKRGKQRGAAGSGLAWSVPDEIVSHYPAGPCGGCGADLDTAADEGVAASDQVHDVPLTTR
jgi:transposase